LHQAGKRVCVLVADDEVNIADSLAMILELHGFRAVSVYSGESAVERAQTLKPDVLITDLFMGGMTGVQAAIRITNAVPGCRVLVITGQTAVGDLAAVEAEGQEFPVLQKPFHPALLLRFLNEAQGVAAS
jgi:CheY-like chemotaxis protein